ncbi:MAG: NUMOD3 domain-containing DNA-binding protein [Candidatus Enterosoma sp.]|nr:NUMOD3 domain-containing DNA-binding protein [Candidatus Enterosoma sp.]
MSLQRKGRKLTEKWKKNISDVSKGEKNWKFGKHIPIANTTK